jgi:sucrose phosphorylase
MPGVPAIYIQSLLGTRNDLVRVAQTGRARSINRSQHDYATVTGKFESEENLEPQIFSGITDLISVRREHAAFDPYAPFRVLELDPRVFAIQRGDDTKGASISCVVNLTGESIAIDIETGIAGIDLLTNLPVGPGKHTLPAYAIHWLSTEQ